MLSLVEFSGSATIPQPQFAYKNRAADMAEQSYFLAFQTLA